MAIRNFKLSLHYDSFQMMCHLQFRTKIYYKINTGFIKVLLTCELCNRQTALCNRLTMLRFNFAKILKRRKQVLKFRWYGSN